MKVIQTQGKRKQAMARASLREGKGNVKINGQYLDNYSTEISRLRVKEPLVLVGDVAQKVDIDVTVVGGGENGQADAARLAIARALVAYNKDFKKIFY